MCPTLQSIQFGRAPAAALESCLNRQFKLFRPDFHLFAIPKVWKYPAWEQVAAGRSEEHTSELQSQFHLVCRLLLEKKKSYILCSLFYFAFFVSGLCPPCPSQ